MIGLELREPFDFSAGFRYLYSALIPSFSNFLDLAINLKM